MGEVVRQVLVDLINEELIFSGLDTKNVMERGRFFTKYVSEIESDQVLGVSHNTMLHLAMTTLQVRKDTSAVRTTVTDLGKLCVLLLDCFVLAELAMLALVNVLRHQTLSLSTADP